MFHLPSSSLQDALQRGCNCNPHCTGRCRHQVYFVYKIARVYNGHIVKSFESDRMRKADKDIPSGPSGLKNDRVAAASEVSRSFSLQFRSFSAG